MCTCTLQVHALICPLHVYTVVYACTCICNHARTLCCIHSITAIFCFYADDLPIRGFIGHLEEVSILPHKHRTYLWTHLHFTFEYNGDQVGTN